MIAFRSPLFDGQLRRTIGHCTYGGAELGECLATAATIKDGDRDSWYTGWMALAARTGAAAQASATAGHRQSALTAFLRASNYYRCAYVFHLEAPVPPTAREAYRRHRDAFRGAAAAMRPQPEPVSIPFGDLKLPAYFCAVDDSRRPLVISVGGYDSTAEESYFWNAAAAVARGYHCLVFDGPGQGAMLLEQGIPFRPDWEAVISAVIDAAVVRDDVDTASVVLMGESWGGYLAPRAAVYDRRIAACVLDPPQVGLYRALLSRLPLPAGLKLQLPHGPGWLVACLQRLLAYVAKRPTAGWALRRGMLTHGVTSPWEYFVDAVRYEQEHLIGEIRCPTLVCHAQNDELAGFSRAFFETLRCKKRYILFTVEEGAGEHCVSGNRALFHERAFDWLDEQLATPAC